MDWGAVVQLGVGAVIACVLIVYGVKFLKWLIPFLIDRAMEPVMKVVNDFKNIMENHMDHQSGEHEKIIEREEEQTVLIRQQTDVLKELLNHTKRG